MQLSSLRAALGLPPGAHLTDPEITGITHNSSWVEPGNLFVALRGANTDGHDHLPQALQRGAAAVMGEGLPDGVDCFVPYLTVPHGRQALADAAAELAGHPSRGLGVVGVTGTDGKTTTAWMARHLARAAGLRTGFLSTVGYELPDGVLRQFPAHFTTPEAPQVQSFLSQLRAAGADAVVIEASSHAFALDRVRAVDWDVAVWTHLTREHLDFHGSVEGYFAEKRKLVERAKHAVLNLDDPWAQRLRGIAPSETTYSAEGDERADWWATAVNEGPRGLEFTVHSPLGSAALRVPMVGTFNVANALAALAAAAHVSEADLSALAEGLATLPAVPGRMELVPCSEVRVIVDFAHTPPSLEKALATVRATTDGNLWVVLGSAGGPRDPSKRAPLGEVASRLADRVVFTEEDPRYTPIWDILHEMERGAREGAHAAGREPNWKSIADRAEAIEHAIGAAEPGDTVLLAGKGPEETMERETETIRWDEVGLARAAIKRRHARIR